MYIAIIMEKGGEGQIIHYPNMILFDEDMKIWNQVSWAYLYDIETGDQVMRYPEKQRK